MQLGMIGLGRMGNDMVRRLLRAGHQCVVYDLHQEAVEALVKEGAVGATSHEDFAQKLKKPRVSWMMVPAAVVDQTLKALVPFLEADDIVVNGGNSFYQDDIRRAGELTHHRVQPYKRLSWGPKEVDAIIASSGHWHNPTSKEKQRE